MGKKKHAEFLLAPKEARHASILQQGCEEVYEEQEGKKKAHQVSLGVKRSPTGFLLTTTLRRGVIKEKQVEKEEKEIYEKGAKSTCKKNPTKVLLVPRIP
jgi:hypothetical protein